MADGKVITGYSNPFVALYQESNGTVTYSGGRKLARGVDVSTDITTTEDNKFYADNVVAESAKRKFASGTLNLTVDGLLAEAERMIHGLPAADTNGFTHYGDEATYPYCGFGCVIRYQSDGVESYTAFVLRKIRFSQSGTSAATQQEDVDWQTQALSAEIMRDDTATHDWKYQAEDLETEAAAIAKVKSALNIAA